MGWLHATPEKKTKARCADFDDEDPYFVMPDLGCVEYISELWLKCGRCKNGGMSVVALDWVDVAAFNGFYGLDSFEADSIILMSREYCSGLNMTGLQSAPYKREYSLEEWAAREKTIERSFIAGENEIKQAR